MNNYRNKNASGIFCLMLVIFNLALFIPGDALGGAYLNSAHGNSSYGVSRSSMAGFGYPKGLCAHCHEQHASVDGAEPDSPPVGPDKYALFYKSFSTVTQTDNFCLKCHDNTTNVASVAITNRSYSYRAGGSGDSRVSVKQAFENPPSVSFHDLDNIRTFIATRWNYSADSNPCAACHNPHSAQGDPANLPAGTKTTTLSARGWPVSRPSLHNRNNNTWGLWGDIEAERMSNYIATYGGVYQAPFYSGGINYEPGGSTTTNGSNLTDFVTFCTDCHNASNTIYSNSLFRNLRTIDWLAGDAHGGQQVASANRGADNRAPYGTPATNYVLACTDCHEPHGSPNQYLLRPQVNGVPSTFSDGRFYNFCIACHQFSAATATHAANGVVETSSNCISCHFHGAGLAPNTIF